MNPPAHNDAPSRFISEAHNAGCPPDQVQNFIHAGIMLQPRQLAASVAARLCDQPDGPTAVGYGGARGGGKSHWLLAQVGADDCQRLPGLKCLLLRKVAKSNLESIEDLRLRVLHSLPHDFSAARGILAFPNGSRIVIRHYQHESEINAFLGLEYDLIAIDEATTLTARKYMDVRTCLRTSKPNWRPRLYSTTNPGGVGHEWYRQTFIVPSERRCEIATRFIPARVEDNKFTKSEYVKILDECVGWQKKAWRDGSWQIPAGQFFNTFRTEVHVIDNFNEYDAVEWFAAMDYGYTHYTVVLLGCRNERDNVFILDEHVERLWIPERHALAVKSMLLRHRVFPNDNTPWHIARRNPGARLVTLPSGEIVDFMDPRAEEIRGGPRVLSRFVAGSDVFSRESNGASIANQFRKHGFSLRPANSNRVEGWAAILNRLGDPDAGIAPTLFIHQRCERLLNCLPYLQHDPDSPADILKTNVDEEGLGGDDAADALRYLISTKPRTIQCVKLGGF